MHAPLNGVGMPPAIPSRRIHPSIIPHQLVAVCCVICRLFHELPPHSFHTLSFVHYIATDLAVRTLLRISA